MLNKEKYFYIEEAQKAVTKTHKIFRWFFTIPTKKESPTTSKEVYSNNKKLKTLAPYLSFAFFSVLILSVFYPHTTFAAVDWGKTLWWLSGGAALDTVGKWMLDGLGFVGDAAAKPFKDGVMWAVTELGMVIFTLLSLILSVAGSLFDFVVNFTVIDLTENINNISTGIEKAWRVLRDLANMLFIFVLLYVSIATILQLSSVDTKRMLKNVVIVALLINFSMFFTEIIIDVTNTFATAFHQAMVTEIANSADYPAGKPPEDAKISEAFMHSTGLLSTYFDEDPSSEALKKTANGELSSLLGLIFVLGTFIIVLSFVLLAGAFFLAVRLIMFILLIILSPLAFISAIIPQTSGSFQRWFKALTNNALFAPVFMALLWVSMVMLQETNNIVNPTGIAVASVVGEDGKFVDTSGAIFQVILAIGFLLASLLIAKTLSIHGASKATQIGSKWGRRALRGGAYGAVGAGAYMANRTAGKYAAKRADSQELKDRAARGSRWANMQLMAYDKLSKTGKKGGYRGVEDRRRGKAKKRAELYNTSAREKDQVRTLQEQAKASKDPAKIKAAQQERDRVLGVSSQEAKKRQDLVERAANKRIEAIDRVRRKKGQQAMTRDEVATEKRQFKDKRIKKMEEKRGFTMKEQLSQEQKLKSEYVKSIKDNILTNNAHIRESLKELKKEDKS